MLGSSEWLSNTFQSSGQTHRPFHFPDAFSSVTAQSKELNVTELPVRLAW